MSDEVDGAGEDSAGEFPGIAVEACGAEAYRSCNSVRPRDRTGVVA